jgi:hypothetical protein
MKIIKQKIVGLFSTTLKLMPMLGYKVKMVLIKKKKERERERERERGRERALNMIKLIPHKVNL